MKRTFGLCLGAGGARGVAHIGFLQALEERSLRPDYIAGCSFGAVVGGCYAAGIPLSEIKQAALSFRLIDLTSVDMKMIKNNGMFRNDKIKEYLRRYLKDISFNRLNIPFRCVATDMMTGKQLVFSQGFVLDAVIASSSIPFVFQPTLTAKGDYLIDGGILDRVPVEVLKDMGADKVVAVDVLSTITACKQIPKNILELMLKMIDVMDIQRTALLKEKRQSLIDLWVEPDLKEMSAYAVKDASFAYGVGYECGKQYADQIEKLLQS